MDDAECSGQPFRPSWWTARDGTADGQKRHDWANNQRRAAKYWNANLAEFPTSDARMPTTAETGQPRGTDGTRAGRIRQDRRPLMLPSAAAQWPTPRTSDPQSPKRTLNSNSQRENKARTMTYGANLSDFSTVADASSQRQQRPELGTTYSGNRGRKHMDQPQLRRPLFAQAQPTPPGPTSSPDGQRPQPSTNS